MPVFKYKAALRNGKKKTGVIDADSRTQAARRLRKDGLYPIELTRTKSETRTRKSKLSLSAIGFLKRVPKESIAATIRQLATLLKADLPLDKALDAVIRGENQKSELQNVMSEVREHIREGGSLANAFSKYPHIFNTTFVTMVQAGENSGTLDIVMSGLADHIDQQLELRRKIQSTLAYPILMFIVGACVVVFLLSFVVPKVTEIFFDMERALPLPTQILLTVSDLMRKSWNVLLLLFLGGGYAFYRFIQTPRGKALYDAYLLKIPVLGDVVCQLTIGRFTKTLGMLLKNGVSLVTSLEIAKSVAANTSMKKIVEQMHTDVQEGKPLTGPMERSHLFNNATVQMIAAGEQSGRLDEMLLIVAANCENKVSMKLQILTSLMEPMMILLLGGIVGFVVMAIMLPIFEMSSLVGG